MAITNLDSYSDSFDAWINNADQGDHTAGALPPANQSRGRVSVGAFKVTFASQAAGEDVGLVKIPKGARLLAGVVIASASFGSCQISIGLKGADNTGFIDAAGSVSDDVAALKAAATITTTQLTLGTTVALKYMYLTEKELWVTATTSAASAGTDYIAGHILYVVD